MKTISLEKMPSKGPRERIEEYLAAIPDGEAVIYRDAMSEMDDITRYVWDQATRTCRLRRFVGNREMCVLVNRKTAKALKDAGEK